MYLSPYTHIAASWEEPDGDVVARGLAFSKLFCIVFAQTDYIYTLQDSSISTFDELVNAVESGLVSRICAEGSPGGGTVMTCQNTFFGKAEW